MTTSRSLLAISLVLLVAFPPLSTGQGAGGSGTPNNYQPGTYTWWGDTTIGQGFHMRVPVYVSLPDIPDPEPRINAPVMTQINLADVLMQAGWVSAPSGDRNIIQAFRLDENSVRVVEMTNTLPFRTGSFDGRLIAQDASIPASDPRRYEIPSLAIPGFMNLSTESKYDSRTNPIITVYWHAPGTTDVGQVRSFVVYFDVASNQVKQTPRYQGEAHGALESLYWTGAGEVLYGYARGNPSAPAPVQVWLIGLEDNTRASVEVLKNGVFVDLNVPGSTDGSFVLSEGELRDITLANAQNTIFKVTADRPLIGFVDITGFVPSTTGGLTGREFYFATDESIANDEDDAVYFMTAMGSSQETHVSFGQVGGETESRQLNSPSQPYAYSTGSRSSNFDSSTCEPDPDLPSFGVYRVTVDSGAPIFVQLQPDRVMQVPAMDGAPTGTRFDAVTGYTDWDLQLQPRQCVPDNRGGTYWAASTGEQSRVNLSSRNLLLQVDPPATATNTPPPRNVGTSPAGLGGPFTIRASDRLIRDHALTFWENSNTPMWLLSGNNMGSGPAPALAGPLGGASAGRDFTSIGPTLIIAPYPDTVVNAQLTYNSGSESRTITMTADNAVIIDNRDNTFPGVLQASRLKSNKPIMVYPIGNDPGYLASIPAFLNTSIGSADFRGPLISISSPTGLDPVTGSTLAGKSIVYPILIRNLGRNEMGSGIPDTVDLRRGLVPEGWSMELDRSVVTLGAGETATVYLTVTPDKNVPTESVGSLAIEAVSRSNAAVRDSLKLVTFLRSSYEVGLWFDAYGGDALATNTTKTGEPANYTLVVSNEGTVEDVIRLETNSAESWDVIILDGKEELEVKQVKLDPQTHTKLRLRVTPPDGLLDGTLTTKITAISTNSPAAIARVTATTLVRAPSDLQLEVVAPTQIVNPGEEAIFAIRLKNAGAGSADVRISLQHDAQGSWTTPQAYLLAEDGLQRVPSNQVSMGPREERTIYVNTTPPADALWRDSSSIRLKAATAGDKDTLDEVLRTLVKPLHDIRIKTPGAALSVIGGSNATVPVRMENLGNLDELIGLQVRDAPSGWDLQFPALIYLAREATQVLDIVVTPSSAPKPGERTIKVDAVSADGTRTPLEFKVRVETTAAASTGSSGALQAQPGRTVAASFPVRNDGNVPLVASIEPMDSELWLLADGGLEETIPPGATQSMQVIWKVPRTAKDGVSTHQAVLKTVPKASGALVSTKTLSAEIDVGRPDLTLSDVKRFAGVAGEIVYANIKNDGVRTAYDVKVVLDVGSERVDTLHIDAIPPGGSTSISLLQNLGRQGTAQVVIDPDDLVVEKSEANNRMEVDGEPKEAPAPSVTAILVGLAAASMLVLRRRRDDHA